MSKVWWKREWHASVQLEISFGCKNYVASLLFFCLFNKALLSSTKIKTHYFTLKLRMSDMNNQNNLKESLSFNIFESLTSKTYSVEQHAV